MLRLVEQGRLRLDDTLARWLPSLDEGPGEVHVGELLTHSAGLTRDSRDAGFWLLEQAFPTAAELTDRADPVLGRHARFKYSNIGFGLAGLVVEAVCGEPYDVVAQREVLDVLGVTDTSTDTAGRSCPVGYSARRGGVPRRPLELPAAAALAPAAGYTSTAADLCAFAMGPSHTKVGDRHVHGHGGAYPGFITSTRFVAADRLVAVVLAKRSTRRRRN